MSWDVETRLRAFGEQLERGVAHVEVDEVLGTTTSIGGDSDTVSVEVTLVDPPTTTPTRRQRWPIVAVAAALVAIVAVGVILAVGNDDSTVEVPADQPTTNAPTTAAQVTQEAVQLGGQRAIVEAAGLVGFVGLPPVAAQPSLTERGPVVLSFSPCPSSLPFDGLNMYEDGSLIWAVSGRLLEQRLTPEGVELMLSELRGSGLLETAPNDDGGECPAGWYAVQTTGNAGRWAEFLAPVDAHVARLVDPASWLPASAWEAREFKPFVPSAYTIYIWNGGTNVLYPSDPAPTVPAIQELFGAKHWECQTNPNTGENACYTDFTTDQARALADALDAAGLYPTIRGDGSSRLQYRQILHPEEPAMHIDFWPQLP